MPARHHRLRKSRYDEGKDLPEERKKAAIKEFNLRKGLIVAVISGILSACMSFAISAGKGMAEAAEAQGANPLFRNNVSYVVIMLGGLTTNFIWCMYLNTKNKTFGDYTNKRTPLFNNYFFSALAGLTWFMQFFFYGMGESNSATMPAPGSCIWPSSS